MEDTPPDQPQAEPVSKKPRRKRKAAGAGEPPPAPPAPDPDRPHSLPLAICLFLIFAVPTIYTFCGAIKHGIGPGSIGKDRRTGEISSGGAFGYSFLGLFMLGFTLNLLDSIRVWRKSRRDKKLPPKAEQPNEPDK